MVTQNSTCFTNFRELLDEEEEFLKMEKQAIEVKVWLQNGGSPRKIGWLVVELLAENMCQKNNHFSLIIVDAGAS
jgi:hypothetical protein